MTGHFASSSDSAVRLPNWDHRMRPHHCGRCQPPPLFLKRTIEYLYSIVSLSLVKWSGRPGIRSVSGSARICVVGGAPIAVTLIRIWGSMAFRRKEHRLDERGLLGIILTVNVTQVQVQFPSSIFRYRLHSFLNAYRVRKARRSALPKHSSQSRRRNAPTEIIPSSRVNILTRPVEENAPVHTKNQTHQM